MSSGTEVSFRSDPGRKRARLALDVGTIELVVDVRGIGDRAQQLSLIDNALRLARRAVFEELAAIRDGERAEKRHA